MVFSDSNIIDEVVSKEHSIDGRAVDVKKAIPHAIHQVKFYICLLFVCLFQGFIESRD